MDQLEFNLDKQNKLNTYERKQLEKAQHYEEKARKLGKQSQNTLDSVRSEREMIPLGQPILVGHHSEKRHRNHLARLENRERRGWEDRDKAEHYAEKAQRIQQNIKTDRVISSDDPDAIQKLEAKLVRLEDERTQIKEFNKKARKDGTEQAPAYLLKNLAGNIRSVKERIKRLEAIEEIGDEDIEVNGVRMVKDKADNRVKLFFPDKPSEEIRAKLKSRGFRWASREKAWQRHLNNAGIYAAERILEELGGNSNGTNNNQAATSG